MSLSKSRVRVCVCVYMWRIVCFWKYRLAHNSTFIVQNVDIDQWWSWLIINWACFAIYDIFNKIIFIQLQFEIFAQILSVKLKKYVCLVKRLWLFCGSCGTLLSTPYNLSYGVDSRVQQLPKHNPLSPLSSFRKTF